ncbi:MAG: CHAT domain-containing protein [Cyclobacteriaceae bacterium]|nr:CHAT domain-containing protein [Cyclobacteriaceae bacterium]
MPIRLALIATLLVCNQFLLLSQPNVQASLNKANMLVKKNTSEAFVLIQEIRNQAIDKNDIITELKCLDLLGELRRSLSLVQQERIASWMKQRLSAFGTDRSLAVAQLHYLLGNFFTDQPAAADSALYHFNQALSIRLPIITGNSELVAQCYHGLGDVYKYIMHDYDEAEKNYEQALKIRESIVPIDTLAVARNYYNLATTNRSQGDFEKALEYGSTTVNLSRAIHHVAMLRNSYTVLANIYRDMHKSDKARDSYDKSIRLTLSSDKSASILAWNYIGIGETYLKDSLWDASIVNLHKAMPLLATLEKQGALTEELRNLWIHGQMKLAQAYLMKSDFPHVERTFRTHFLTLQRLQILAGRIRAESLTGYGDYQFVLKNYDSALHYYQSALHEAIPGFKSHKPFSNPDTEEVGNSFYIHEILSRKGKVFQQRYLDTSDREYVKLALREFLLAEKLMSRQRNTLEMDESKRKFLDSHFNLYEQVLWCIDVLHEQQPADSLRALAFRFMERSKARTLRDVLDKGPIARQQSEFNRSRFSLLDALYQEEQKTFSDSIRISALQQQLVTLDRQRKRNEEVMKEKFPGYMAATDSTYSTVQQVQHSIHNDQAVLEYFFGDESVYALCIRHDGVLYKRLGSADSIRNAADKLRAHFNDEHSISSREAFVNFATSSSVLYAYLLKPFHGILTGVKNIHIIPDGVISQVPFEVLISEKPSLREVNYWRLKYAVRHYSIGYSYSASLLLAKNFEARENPSVLAMGFGGGNERSSPDQMVNLGGSEHELDVLKGLFTRGKFLVGLKADKSEFKKLAPAFDIIHLAVHGRGDRDHHFSSSLFFKSSNDGSDDGQLHAYELYGLQLDAALAVLTACETGVGKAYKGEGMMSIATAFSYAGCQNTLMSLWKVNDQTSVGLMGMFYQNLLSGKRIDDALMMAKLNYLEEADEITADPRIWAPMVAYGKLTPVVKQNKSSTLVYSALTAALVLLLVFRWRGLLVLPSRRS